MENVQAIEHGMMQDAINRLAIARNRLMRQANREAELIILQKYAEEVQARFLELRDTVGL